MNIVVVIPSRYGSKRFPAKPFAKICGVTLLERVWRIAKAVKNVSDVYVATDDERIVSHANSFGAQAIMTSENCSNGTERAYDAAMKLQTTPDAVINFQGDAVLTPPWIVQAVVDELVNNPEAQIVTPAVQLTADKYELLAESKMGGKATGTLVTFDINRNALYFSKSMIPFLRTKSEGLLPVYRHIGMYGYRLDALKKYMSLPPGQFEQAEQLEQLRALEQGMPVKIVLVDYCGRTHWAVDNPEDIERVEQIIASEGELV